MQVVINGEKCDVPTAETVTGLLERLALAKGPCAVEVNRRLVPKKAHDRTTLAAGDRIELVSLVGGG